MLAKFKIEEKNKEEQNNLERKKIHNEFTEKRKQNIKNANIQMATFCSSYEMETNGLQHIVLSFTDVVLTNEKAFRDTYRNFELQREKVLHLFNLTAHNNAGANDLEF